MSDTMTGAETVATLARQAADTLATLLRARG